MMGHLWRAFRLLLIQALTVETWLSEDLLEAQGQLVKKPIQRAKCGIEGRKN
jgi:hypothetical protein